MRRRGILEMRGIWDTAVRLFALFMLAQATCSLAHAQTIGSACASTNVPLVAFASETITVSNTAKTLTAATWNKTQANGGPAWEAHITIAADNIRVFYDGTTPDATTGHLYVSGAAVKLCNPQGAGGPQMFQLFKMIRQTTDATVTVTYYRPAGAP